MIASDSDLERLCRDAPPRCSTRPFPEYRHLPGSTPHPVRSPAGHSHGSTRVEEDPQALLLEGVDLYNHGFWWESHEAWEEAWILFGRTTPVAKLTQGLIFVAAAHLKHRLQSRRGWLRLQSKARRRLQEVPEVVWQELGLDKERFLGVLEHWWSKASGAEFAAVGFEGFPYLSIGNSQND